MVFITWLRISFFPLFAVSSNSIMQVTVILSFFLIQSFVYLAPSSASHHCGELNIRCPFRLKGSRAHCSRGFMEFVCEGNNTFWNIKGNKYLITEISYPQQTIRLADPTLLSSPCPIPNQIAPPYDFVYYPPDNLRVYVYFLNCSQPLNVSEYIPVPCLSVNGSNTYLYLSSDDISFDMGMVPNFCRNFASTITNENLTTGSDVFMILQKGFHFAWNSGEFYTTSVKECMRELRR